MLVIYLLIFIKSIIAFPQIEKINKVDYLSTIENNIVQEINLTRQYPKKYAYFIEEIKQYYVGNLIKRPGSPSIITEEGISAVEEAIRFLRSVKPAPILRPARGMSLGARDHVQDQGPKGSTGHQGSDGSESWDRVNRYGKWQEIIGENISYGRGNARDIVMGLIIDDGVPGRGHRKNIFNSNFHIIGVAFGTHATYRSMCVITFAGGYKEKKR